MCVNFEKFSALNLYLRSYSRVSAIKPVYFCSGLQELDQFVVRNEMSRKYECSLCSKFGHKSRSNVRNHIESIHYPGMYTYSCDACGTVLNTRRALEVHKSAYHKQLQ